MSDLLHWYSRIHGPRAFRIAQAARSGELERARSDASSVARESAPAPGSGAPASAPALAREGETCGPRG
ncbi:hypothetical protein [Agromyces bauzanensis]|uniref:hypothetical protein n=1 Tax=Agromyces bauzanensis TaxID=1308924 RepID=UPI00166541F5|nr:hypothetical protein [Agromyces bauzanensis]